MPASNSVPINNITKFSSRKASSNRAAAVDKLNTELGLGRILGPYSHSPLESATYSPLYAIPKSEPGKFRLIHDLSKPNGHSVNDNIPDALKSVQYCSIMQVAEFLRAEKMAGSNPYYLAKIDLKDAYRICPIHKQDWKYLGMQFEDKLFIDTCLPMGLGTSCAIFSTISDSLAWVFHKQNPGCRFFNYIDDFLILAPEKALCESALSNVLSSLEQWGFPISPQKTVYPCTSLEFLGLGIDSGKMCFFVPDKKRIKIGQEIKRFLSSKSQRVNVIQKLLGKLNFLCTTFLPGKSLMAGLYHTLSGVLSSQGWARRRITSDSRADLQVWLSFLANTEGKPFQFIFPDYSRLPTMTTDASGSIGYGCVFGECWFKGVWEDQWWSEQNIALLELIPIYIGIKLWQTKISNNTLNILSDNESVVAMITSFYSRDKKINILLKDLALFCMTENIVVRIKHLAGSENILADRLSRNMEYAHQLPSQNTQYELPSQLHLDRIKQIIS